MIRVLIMAPVGIHEPRRSRDVLVALDVVVEGMVVTWILQVGS
jgi:hypothetical protein